jgi:predicted RNase H-like nuclease (RuvC/YqgF family)
MSDPFNEKVRLMRAAIQKRDDEIERLRAENAKLKSTDMALALTEMSLRDEITRLRARVEVLERVRAATIERSVSGCRASIYELECALKEAEQ